MTTTTEDIATIGWTLATIAGRLKVPVNTVKGWKHRDAWPEPVRQWLHTLADAHRNTLAPMHNGKRTRARRYGTKPARRGIDWNEWLSAFHRELADNA